MTTIDQIQCIGFSLPMFAALICLAMSAILSLRRSGELTQRRLATVMVWTYATSVLCWLGVILFIVDYGAFVRFNGLFFLVMMFNQVLLYKFVFSITGTGRDDRKFPVVNYLVPVAIVAALSVWSLFVPYEVQYSIVRSRGEAPPGYGLYTRFFMAASPLYVIYNVLYSLLGLFRVKRYRRAVVNYSADEGRGSVVWLYGLIFLIWLSLPIIVGAVSVHKSVLFSSWLTVPGAFLLIFQYLFICYNLMAGNYVIIRQAEFEDRTQLIDRKKLETYVKDKKPYLDPNLKIMDMCAGLGTNRSYLSSFINKEYGMNFSRYINLMRLEELDRLRLDPRKKNTLGGEIVLEAGFGSYRSYLRVKNAEDARRRVVF